MNKTQDFAVRMLRWYDVNKRDLPFRQTKNSYNIWLSEIMAQQTQIATVIPYYERFIAVFPDFESLAVASEDEVFKLWEGLGYYSRARRLIPCAQTIVKEHGGQVPNDYKKALALPGIGAYTAGAILSICYNNKVPAVDGNVLRVMTRYWADGGDIAKEKVKKDITTRLKPYMPERAGDFNQSLIELGAMVCTKSSPKCDICPVGESCEALKQDAVSQYPFKQKRKKSPVYQVPVHVMCCGDRYLVYKKEGGGLLSGYWAFPHEVIGASGGNALAAETLDLTSGASYQTIGTAKHVFTHQLWQMEVRYYQTDSVYAYSEGEYRWVTLDDMQDLAFTTAMKKVIDIIYKSTTIQLSHD